MSNWSMCAKCAYYQGDKTEGHCHRRPPTVVVWPAVEEVGEYPEARTYWPEVSGTEGCGEGEQVA